MENLSNTNIEKKDNLGLKLLVHKKLGLEKVGDSSGKDFLKLSNHPIDDKVFRNLDFNTPEDFSSFFEGYKMVEPDNVCRPIGQTTLFTTSGVQKIETILRKDGDLKNDKFICIQPVIRSQFMDKVSDGTSSSFVNFSLESINSSQEDFIEIIKKLVDFIIQQGVRSEDLRFIVDDNDVKWGDKNFKNTYIKLYVNSVELGDCVYIHNYPVTSTKSISITDLGFGVERLRWALKKSSFFMSGFENIYINNQNVATNLITKIIDPIKSMVLIAGEGVKSSNKNHGYRLRQFSKRFVENNRNLKINEKDLIHTALLYWKKWGYVNATTEEEIENVIITENQRNFNMNFLEAVKNTYDISIYIDINQTTENFLKQAGLSLSKDIINNILKIT